MTQTAPKAILTVAFLCLVVFGCPRDDQIETVRDIIDAIQTPTPTERLQRPSETSTPTHAQSVDPTATSSRTPTPIRPTATETADPTQAPTGTATARTAPATATPRGTFDFGAVRWLDRDVSMWVVSHELRVRFVRDQIILDSTPDRSWPPREIKSRVIVDSNAWVVFQFGGQWFAGTWEFLRSDPYQEGKRKRSVAGDHLNKSQNVIPRDWRPAPGQRLGFFVSGLVRGGHSNVQERSEVAWIFWP